MEIRKKHIFIDTNSVNDNGTYFIHEIVVDGMKLQKGDQVIAYQESDSWDAEITFLDGKWGVVLQSDATEISKEREEGHHEGFWEGVYLERIRIIRLLENLNVSPQLIEQVKERLRGV